MANALESSRRTINKYRSGKRAVEHSFDLLKNYTLTAVTENPCVYFSIRFPRGFNVQTWPDLIVFQLDSQEQIPAIYIGVAHFFPTLIVESLLADTCRLSHSLLPIRDPSEIYSHVHPVCRVQILKNFCLNFRIKNNKLNTINTRADIPHFPYKM